MQAQKKKQQAGGEHRWGEVHKIDAADSRHGAKLESIKQLESMEQQEQERQEKFKAEQEKRRQEQLRQEQEEKARQEQLKSEREEKERTAEQAAQKKLGKDRKQEGQSTVEIKSDEREGQDPSVMKTQTYGASELTDTNWLGFDFPRLIKADLKTQANDARANYRLNRENGRLSDNPAEEFPYDGTYSWATPYDKKSKVIYTEGRGDHAWMRKKDNNTLERLLGEGKVDIVEHLVEKWKAEDAEAWRIRVQVEKERLAEGRRKDKKEKIAPSSLEFKVDEREDQDFSKMKVQTFGYLSDEVMSKCDPPNIVRCNPIKLVNDGVINFNGRSLKSLAASGYRENRENGEECDNPKEKFPEDGKCRWETQDIKNPKLRYDEGSKDREWMRQKDNNCLDRLMREGKVDAVERKIMEWKSESADVWHMRVQAEKRLIKGQKTVEEKIEEDSSITQKQSSPLPSKPLRVGAEEEKQSENSNQGTLVRGAVQDRESGKGQAEEQERQEGEQKAPAFGIAKSDVFSVEQQRLREEMAQERQQFEAKLSAQYREQEQKISQEIAAVRSQLAGQKQQQDPLLLQRLSALESEQKSLQEVRQKVDALRAEQTAFIHRNLEQHQEIYRKMQELGQNFDLNLKTRGEELQGEQKELAGEIAKIEQQLAAKTGDEKELQVRLEALQRESGRQIMDKLQLEMQQKFVEFSEETAEQRRKLQQQLVTDRQQLESKFEQDSQQHAIREEKITAQLAVLTDKDARYEELHHQLHELQVSQELLMKDYRAKQNLLAKQAYLYQTPQLRFFYRCVQLKLAEVFLAIKSLASGMIDIPVSKKTQIAQKVIEIIGGNIPLPGASLIAAVIGKGLGMKDEADAKRRIEQQSASVPTIADIETIAESTARELSYRYEEQLMQLTPEGAKMLGACALARIMCYMDDHFGDLAAGAESAQLQECMTKQLMASVFKVKLKQGFLGVANKKIPTEHGQQDWTENGIFMGAGIIVKAAKEGDQDMYFSGKMKLHVTPTEVFVIDTKPEKYGYRLGTAEEATGLGLKQTPGRVGVEIGKGIGLSRGANMQIMQVTKRTEDQEGQTEVLRIQLQQETDKRAQVEEKVLALEEELAKQREKQRQTDEKLAVLMKFMMQHQGEAQPQATMPQSGAAATPSTNLSASSAQSSSGSAPSSSFFGSSSPTTSSSSSSGFPPAKIEHAEHKDDPEPAAGMF